MTDAPGGFRDSRTARCRTWPPPKRTPLRSRTVSPCGGPSAALRRAPFPKLVLSGGWDADFEVLCGTLARFLVTPPGGADQRDVHNPDAKLRNRKLLGLPILTGFSEDGAVWRGTIYDPKSGKSYRSVLRRLDGDRLEVKGCIGPFCQTQVWRRGS